MLIHSQKVGQAISILFVPDIKMTMLLQEKTKADFKERNLITDIRARLRESSIAPVPHSFLKDGGT